MEDVWKLIYDSFEGGPGGARRTVTASNALHNELQFRLNESIARYRHDPSVELIDTIAADVQLAQSLGFISEETTEKILDKLVEVQ